MADLSYIAEGLRPLAVPLAELHCDPANARAKHATDRIAASLKAYGQRKPIVANRAQGGKVEAGNGTLKAAQSLGWSHIAVVWMDDDPATAAAYGIADNRLGDLSEWDVEALGALVGTVEDLFTGFEPVELKDLLPAEEPQAADPGAQIDKAAELQAKWQVAPGDLWELGAHRLVCGDCTDAAVVARMMGGEKAGAVVTDPPYAILGGGTSSAGKGIESAFDRQFFRAWFHQFLGILDVILDDGTAQWMTIDWRGATAIEEALVGTRWRMGALGVWNRGGLGMGYALRKTYENFVFLAANGWKRTKTDEPDIWDHQWTSGDRKENHQAEKPVILMQRAIELCGGDVVIDPFLGSGTTLIACERLGRKCRAVEIEPKYCAVTLERWATMTGKTPVRVERGSDGRGAEAEADG